MSKTDVFTPIESEENKELQSDAANHVAALQHKITILCPLRNVPAWGGYVFAVAIIIASYGLHYYFRSIFPHPFLLFFPAIFLTSFLFSRGSGYFAAVLGSLLGYYFYLKPEDSWAFKGFGESLSVIIFLGISCAAAWVIESFRNTVDELGESLAALENAHEQLEEFAHIVSHDLKEPARGIYNYATFLEEDYRDRLDGDGRDKLRVVKDQALRMTDLIDNLLRYALIGKEKQFEEANTGEIVTDVLKCMEIKLQEENVKVSVDGDFPRLSCNKVHLGEVFRNLITNAIKYNDKPEKLIEIGCRIQDPRAKKFEFFVRDNGIGIPKKRQQDVFKMFRRLHSRSKYGGGTGSGLAIVKKIIEGHGGKVWIESEEGKGCTFFFYVDTAFCEKVRSRAGKMPA
jgi:signal transduction histidine kinase